MLSEEDKEAIEYLKILKKHLGKDKQEMIDKGTYKFYETFEINLDIVLNLITKLQKEVKEQTHKKTYARQNIIYKNKQLGELRKNINKLQKENEEKDKQIDLMTEHIVSSAIVDDTVCAIKCDCESDILEDCSHEKMLNCTKLYFETKAKKGE